MVSFTDQSNLVVPSLLSSTNNIWVQLPYSRICDVIRTDFSVCYSRALGKFSTVPWWYLITLGQQRDVSGKLSGVSHSSSYWIKCVSIRKWRAIISRHHWMSRQFKTLDHPSRRSCFIMVEIKTSCSLSQLLLSALHCTWSVSISIEDTNQHYDFTSSY
jgi:hypothetical protein